MEPAPKRSQATAPKGDAMRQENRNGLAIARSKCWCAIALLAAVDYSSGGLHAAAWWGTAHTLASMEWIHVTPRTVEHGL
jgi:hypothetical protein